MITQSPAEQFLRKLSAAGVDLHLGDDNIRIAGPADFLDGSDWDFLRQNRQEVIQVLREREKRRREAERVLGPRPPSRQRQWKSRTTRARAIALDLNPIFWEPML